MESVTVAPPLQERASFPQGKGGGGGALWTMPLHFVANGVHSTARGSDSKAAAAAAAIAMEGYIMPSGEEAFW